jgi:hypothetical protein
MTILPVHQINERTREEEEEEEKKALTTQTSSTYRTDT